MHQLNSCKQPAEGQFNSNLKCNFKLLFVEIYWQWNCCSVFFPVQHFVAIEKEKLDLCPMLCGSNTVEPGPKRTTQQWKRNFIIFIEYKRILYILIALVHSQNGPLITTGLAVYYTFIVSVCGLEYGK